jgi:SAM-dependent methyltransferase
VSAPESRSGVHYSPHWFTLFLDRVPPDRTAAEVAFLVEHLPLPSHHRLLDVCCGPGRLAAPLAGMGYEITGIDTDESAIAQARRRDPRGDYRCIDVRDMPAFAAPFDATVCMWSSFGWFSDEENQNVLDAMIRVTRPAGRLVLDVYNASFFEKASAERQREIDGMRVIERIVREGRRLHVTLNYDGGATDTFQWRIYSAEELAAAVRRAGAELRCACREFDSTREPSHESPRMQLVFEVTAHAPFDHVDKDAPG